MIALAAPIIALAGRPILRDIDLHFAPGECVALCGPNGAGKSTLLRALAGLLPGTPRRDPRRLAYLPQGARVAWNLTVADIARLGRLPHGDHGHEPVERALSLCGVTSFRDIPIDRLSGGQARRAMLARAFATEPDAFLLDEPTADLDPSAAHEIMALLRATADQGRLVIVVLHAIDLAIRHATRMLVIAEGRIAADAAPEAALPAAASAFGMTIGVDPTPRLLPPP